MDEEQKQRVMKAVLTFNLIIIPYQIFFNLQFDILRLLLGVLIAGVAAGIVYYISK